MGKKVILGLSGGMDSAYVAIKLLEAGYDVTAVNIIMSDNSDCSDRSKALAKQLDIKHIVVDARADFKRTVMQPFASAYVNGLTPNPCVVCNPNIKFAKLFEVMGQLDADYVATGHYAIPTKVDGRWSFRPAADIKKDQGYFLYGLSQYMVSRLILPLGCVLKDDIKYYFATQQTSVVPPKTESTDICFVPDGSYVDVIKRFEQLPPSGDFVDCDGRVLGSHRGIHNYTVGQRKGLGIALGVPAYVSAIDAVSNTVTLSTGRSCVDGFSIRDFNLMASSSISVGERFKVRARYRAVPVDCVVSAVSGDVIEVQFLSPQAIVAKGQSAVFYGENSCIAFGGVIC